MDFALILVVATAVTGAVWLLDLVAFRPGRLARSSGEDAGEPLLVEYSKSFFPILLFVLLLRSFLFEPFRIPSGSMMPTLLEGDFIFVNKFAYGLRLPVINSKILETGEPERGDVVVFRLPQDPSVNYIKRVVGLPGDLVEYDQGSKRLTINGDRVPMELVGQYVSDTSDRRRFELGREMLGEHDHELLLMAGRVSLGGTFEVPEGHYFVMGDNRDDSKDSRYPEPGFVPEQRLVGRAVRIWMNFRWPAEGGPRWNRIGQRID